MFTGSMNSAELYAEFQNDVEELKAYEDKVGNSEDLTRLFSKHHSDKKLTFYRTYKTKRRNRYTIVFLFTRQSGNRKNALWKWEAFSIAYTSLNTSQVYIVFYDDMRLGVVFKAHFLLRYQERFSLVCDEWKVRNGLENAKALDQILSIYILRNETMALYNTGVRYTDKLHIFTPVGDGAILMQWNDDNKTLQANTFITSDMYSKLQLEMNSMMKQKMYQVASESDNFQNVILKWLNA